MTANQIAFQNFRETKRNNDLRDENADLDRAETIRHNKQQEALKTAEITTDFVSEFVPSVRFTKKI